jgi:uncharacterized membrane protein
MSTNPYAAPKAVVADDTVVSKGDFVPGGQALPAARGTAWIGEAWQLFKRQPGMWIGMVLVLFVVFVGLGLIPFVGSLATMLLGPVFAAGLVIGCRALDEGGELELSHLFAGFHERAGTLVGVGALYLAASLVVMLVVGLGMGVGMFTLMGGNPAAAAEMGMTILLAALVMTALLLPAVMAVWFAAPLVVFHQLGAVDAMKQSFIGCVRNIVPFLLYGLVLFLLTILATLPLMLGWLVLGPVLAASLYTAYKDIYLKPRA